MSPQDSDGSPNGDSRDNDAALNVNDAQITFNTRGRGANDHTYDFGFIDRRVVSVGDRVWVDANQNGLQDAGEGNLPGTTV